MILIQEFTGNPQVPAAGAQMDIGLVGAVGNLSRRRGADGTFLQSPGSPSHRNPGCRSRRPQCRPGLRRPVPQSYGAIPAAQPVETGVGLKWPCRLPHGSVSTACTGGDLITVDKTGAAVADIFFKDGFYIFDLPGVRQIAGNVRPGNDGTGLRR